MTAFPVSEKMLLEGSLQRLAVVYDGETGRSLRSR